MGNPDEILHLKQISAPEIWSLSSVDVTNNTNHLREVCGRTGLAGPAVHQGAICAWGYDGCMKLIAVLTIIAGTLNAADTLRVFEREWSVPAASDWNVDREAGTEILRLVHARGPLPGPRRPIQFALADTDYARITLEADVKPLAKSLLIVFAYRDEAHFDYAHLSTDTGTTQPVHNGIFHVYGGERVRISSERGPAAFAATGRWYHVRLTHDAQTGTISVAVDGQPLPALNAVDLSLGGGKVGIGSFDETAEFKNVKITAAK